MVISSLHIQKRTATKVILQLQNIVNVPTQTENRDNWGDIQGQNTLKRMTSLSDDHFLRKWVTQRRGKI